jgi:hypothetical protein
MKFTFTFYVLFISFICVAQPKNYLITATGDSLYGKINLRGNLFTVENTSFVKEISVDDVRKIHCNTIKGSTVVHCMLHLYSDNIYDLELDYIPMTRKDTVMVLKEIYTTDKMNLYFGTDNARVQYYFYKTPADPVPVQLVVRYYLGGGLTSFTRNPADSRGEKSRMHIEVDKGYVNQLKNVMSDCETISAEVWELLDYRDYSFKKLIRKYNNCN